MIAGLETISHGELRINGKLVNDLPSRDRGIAMVFQSYALYPHMSVADNLGFGLKISGVGKDEIERRRAEAARMLGLDPYMDRRPSQLSGGQRQRVAIGRAMVREPEVFLFDEPLSNLDAKLRNQTRIEIKRLQRQLGATVIFVTHDQVEAMTLADKIVVLHDGLRGADRHAARGVRAAAQPVRRRLHGRPIDELHRLPRSARTIPSRPATSIFRSRPIASRCRQPGRR